MKVSLNPMISDASIDVNATSSQRQLSISVSALSGTTDRTAPLNLCLVLDHSGSMSGEPLETVKKASISLVEKLAEVDRLSVVAFDHRAKVLVPNQRLEDTATVKRQIEQLKSEGGTAIDEGMKMGLEEIIKGKKDTISQIFLLTDGENEHGDNARCLKIAQLASESNITFNTLGFGENWNQDILEKIADSAGGTLRYIERPQDALKWFGDLFERAQSVSLTNAYLIIELMPKVKLAETKPIAQVAPDTIELPSQLEGNQYIVRLGDLMKDDSRVILVNFYIPQLPAGKHTVAKIQVRYDDPGRSQSSLLCDPILVEVEAQGNYKPTVNPEVQKSILALAKYRQTQLAESKLQNGDRTGAATLLQAAANTALQLGDKGGATVLQTNATRLQSGEELSESDRKKTRIVSKTILQ